MIKIRCVMSHSTVAKTGWREDSRQCAELQAQGAPVTHT